MPVSLESFIEQTNAAESPEQVFTLFKKALHGLGYDRIIYSRLSEHPSLGVKAGYGLESTYPEDWMAYYAHRRYGALDPVPLFAMHTSHPFTWDQLRALDMFTRSQTDILEEGERDAGLHDGVGIPIHGINGELAGLGLASSAGGTGLDKNMLSILRMLSHQFHIAYSEKQAAEEQAGAHAPYSLTDREKEVLIWVAEGKSDGVIAEIIGIRHRTVRFHMNNIFQKLDVNERTMAVVKAIRHGLILPHSVAAQPAGE